MSRSFRRLTILILLPVALTVSLLGAHDSKKSEAKAPPGEIKKTAGPIMVDGGLDEPAWKEAKPIEVKYIWNDKEIGKVSKEPRMTARYTWDDNHLYIGYETFDKNLVAMGTGEKEGPKGNQREGAVIGHATEKVDVVEFFISFGDTRFFWEIHHNALNNFNDIWCVVVDESWPISKSTMNRFGIYFGNREIIQDDVDAGYTIKTAVKLKPKADGQPSTVNDPSDVDTGYFGEIRLPWHGLGAPMACETHKTVEGNKTIHGPWKMAGQQMLILAVFQDGDLKDHYHHSSPTKGGGWFHKGAEHYPRYVLKE
jgi:Carbohydrate family 9 binding domain-like